MIEAWIDGACENCNPGGTMSAGVVILKDGELMWRHGQIIKPKVGSKPEEWTNNVAEYSALWLCLNYLIKEKQTNQVIIMRGDSQLVIKQMWGTWGMKGGAYVPLALKCKEMLKGFSNATGQWVPREQNKEADELSKQALVKAGVTVRTR